MADERATTIDVQVGRGCISSGICVEIAPDSFELVGLRASPRRPLADTPAARAALVEAVEACPVEAIVMGPVAPGTP
ncbi:ferredoxin [Nocardioides zeae]|uniref:Ferredoxin n=1 Tax=Nocardioides zeae TaxID=1457234 RepID=A0A6P0HFP1_9ACTN|nr:ferredoxin [Nocardioides zeae]NEN77117.1 ferredoxin [Nocardioides zeae]